MSTLTPDRARVVADDVAIAIQDGQIERDRLVHQGDGRPVRAGAVDVGLHRELGRLSEPDVADGAARLDVGQFQAQAGGSGPVQRDPNVAAAVCEEYLGRSNRDDIFEHLQPGRVPGPGARSSWQDLRGRLRRGGLPLCGSRLDGPARLSDRGHEGRPSVVFHRRTRVSRGRIPATQGAEYPAAPFRVRRCGVPVVLGRRPLRGLRPHRLELNHASNTALPEVLLIFLHL